MKAFTRQHTARKITILFSLFTISTILLMSIKPILFTEIEPTAIDLESEYRGFTELHPLGQGENGVDILSQLVHGARISLTISIVVVFFTLTLGTLLGSVAGFKGGWTDHLISGAIDSVLAFPGILLAIALAAVLGPSQKNVIILLSLTGWPSVARLVRGEILKLKNRDFIVSARSVGAHGLRIFFIHMLPNILPLLAIQASFSMAGVIIVESSLSFLGLGVPPGTPTWGGMLASGKNAMMSAWHVSVVPGVMLVLLILSFNFLGDWLRDVYDPKSSTY